ncbi:hypothetical protein GVN24_25205 [Rhizobium sp. CRIBSB]|nr:hypothetical protein [Rhizobium sp. CRIBSB]
MNREVRTALGIAAGVSGLVIGFIFLVRFLVPSILEAHFLGSVITAAVVGIAGVLALCWLAWSLVRWAVQSLKS